MGSIIDRPGSGDTHRYLGEIARAGLTDVVAPDPGPTDGVAKTE